MRRHANLAIAISVQGLDGELEAVLAEAVQSIRTDAIGGTFDWSRFDASRRFRPIESIRRIVDRMRDAYRSRMNMDAAIDETAEMQGKLDRANARRWSANTVAQIAQDPAIPTAVGPAVVATEPQVSAKTRRSWVRRNIDAVVIGAASVVQRFTGRSKSIPEEYFDRIESTLTQGARQAAQGVVRAAQKRRKIEKKAAELQARGEPLTPEIEFELVETFEARALELEARKMREQLAKEPGIARRRAKIIGRDQTEKFNGRATEDRNIKVGVDKYRWNTQGDAKVRQEHDSRRGQIFSWSEPPEDGHPGEPVECRCWASGAFDEAFKSGTLVARTQLPTPLRRGRRVSPRSPLVPDGIDPGQIAFRREVFEAPPTPGQVAREERDRRLGAF